MAAAGAGAAAATAVALPDDGDTAAAGEVMRPLGERVSTAFHDLVGLIVTRGAGAGAGAASVSGSGTVGSCHHAHTHTKPPPCERTIFRRRQRHTLIPQGAHAPRTERTAALLLALLLPARARRRHFFVTRAAVAKLGNSATNKQDGRGSGHLAITLCLHITHASTPCTGQLTNGIAPAHGADNKCLGCTRVALLFLSNCGGDHMC